MWVVVNLEVGIGHGRLVVDTGSYACVVVRVYKEVSTGVRDR